MKITRDVPGQRLTLEREAPRIPPGAASLVLLVVTLPFLGYTAWVLLAAFADGADPGQRIAAVVMVVFWSGLVFSTVRAMRERGRWPTGLDVDRARGELRLRESRLLGGVTPEAIIPLARLAGLNVRRTFKAPSPREKTGSASKYRPTEDAAVSRRPSATYPPGSDASPPSLAARDRRRAALHS